MKFFKLVERWFAVICVASTLLGLLVPQLGRPLGGFWLKVFLAGILFFTGLKIDFRAAGRALAKPWLVVYVVFMLMVVLPLAMHQLAVWLLPPALAIGVMIVVAMPSGLACSSLTDIAGGNTALALVVTMLTSLVCPLSTPWIVRMGAEVEPAGSGGWEFLGRQAIFLAAILFTPIGIAYVVRRLFPRAVGLFRETYTGMSMISLSLLILGAMSESSGEFMGLIRSQPAVAVTLTAFMFGFSALLHVVGYFLAPWRSVKDRAALSINAAYVNNGLAIVFAREFYTSIEGLGAAALLPAILLEIPMVLAILPLRAWVKRRGDRPEGAAPADDSETSSGSI